MNAEDIYPVVLVSQPGRQSLHLLVKDGFVLGRECEGLLLADSQVSRRHLELTAEDGRVLCTDLGSTNGTFLDGERITASRILAAGAVLTLGDTTIRLADRTAQARGIGRESTIARNELRGTSIDVVAEKVADEAWKPRMDSGTVTILFSDIEASTERVSRIGDGAWVELLAMHNHTVREELSKAGGREIQSLGDGFMLEFLSVRRALEFAVAVQQRLGAQAAADPDRGVRVRIGLHTGEVITDGSGLLFGRHVHKAARIANLAAGGQILVSATVRELASGDRDLGFGDGEQVELRGLDGVHVIHEVFWTD